MSEKLRCTRIYDYNAELLCAALLLFFANYLMFFVEIVRKICYNIYVCLFSKYVNGE